jgi:GNAT superfamily N-acetyltransferase
MLRETLQIIDLTHDSPLFDKAYDVFGLDIPPEFLETREFLKNRLRVRDEGPKSQREKILLQDGYTIHLIAAKAGSKIAGAVYGHLISKISGGRSVGFVTYIAVLPEYRRHGIGTRLVEELRNRVDKDALRMTGQPVMGIVFEIEQEGKEEIKGVIRKSHAAPLDIVYYQPALRGETSAERMDLWFLPLDQPASSADEKTARKYPADVVVSMATNLLTMEYVGPDLKGFDPGSKPMTEFLKSVGSRSECGMKG